MFIEIPDEVLAHANLSEKEVKVDILAFLYQKQILTLEKASRLANVSRLDFQRILAERNIPIHYDAADLEMDLRHLSELER